MLDIASLVAVFAAGVITGFVAWEFGLDAILGGHDD
jgi:hypothetical protein